MNTQTTEIREHMPVVCSDGGQFGTVDRVEDSSIKLTRDDKGKQAMKQWSDRPPAEHNPPVAL